MAKKKSKAAQKSPREYAESLAPIVKAASDEMDQAIAFHETWKPMAFDTDLHARMAGSYAGNTFQVIRVSLRREMLSALCRVWDHQARAIDLKAVIKGLGQRSVLDVLGERYGVAPAFSRDVALSIADEMRADLKKNVDEIGALHEAVMVGPFNATYKRLLRLRNEQLAHRQIATPSRQPSDDETERFYIHTLRLIQGLRSVVEAVAYDPADTAAVHRYSAQFFWAGVKSERVEGHPLFRRRRPIPGLHEPPYRRGEKPT